MKIITCIKQVPASSQVEVDPDTGVLIRDGNDVKMNPYDLYALEAAFSIKAQQDKSLVHALTMGPPSAKTVLEEALHMGADDATLLSDRAFAGADVLATAYTLSQVIEYINDYDVVITGKQTTDGDTAQVGPEIAEFLKIPHVPYVKEIIKVEEGCLTLKSGYDYYDEIVKVKTPCLITVEKDAFVPRLPSYKRSVQFKDYKIPMVTLNALKDQDKNHYGLNGSPTQVEEIFPPSSTVETEIFKGNHQENAETMLKILKERKFV